MARTTLAIESIVKRNQLILARITILSSIVSSSVFLDCVSADELLPTGQIQKLTNRDTSNAPLASYQFGYLFGVNRTNNGLWIDHITEGNVLEDQLSIPETFRVLIRAAAVSPDNRFAVCGTSTDRLGKLSSFIWFLRMDGTLVRTIRTSSFHVRKIRFSADGNLWSVGIESDSGLEKVNHDVLRQYDRDGRLVRTMLPRMSISSSREHPTEGAILVTSSQYVALISLVSERWNLISTEGILVSSGPVDLPRGLNVFSGSVSDSGRIFIQGYWASDSPHRDSYPRLPVFEIDQELGLMKFRRTNSVYLDDSYGLLLGSEGEELLFLTRSSTGERKIVWSKPD
ncbi:MAG: hypothetical protein OXN89_26320 [Bryobacterales bacterium]|nr:hypothetical protein [Bryobacterales bacterium]